MNYPAASGRGIVYDNNLSCSYVNLTITNKVYKFKQRITPQAAGY